MKYQKIVFLEEALAQKLQKYCMSQPPEGEVWMGEGETYSISVAFPNRFAMDLRVCGVKREEGGDNTSWAEAVLIDPSGQQAACTDPEETLEDVWELTDPSGNSYAVEVKSSASPLAMRKYLDSLGSAWEIEPPKGGYRVASVQIRLTKRAFLDYIRESFSVSPDAFRLVENIIDYVCAKRFTDATAQLSLLASLLGGAFGLTEEEMKMLEIGEGQ